MSLDITRSSIPYSSHFIYTIETVACIYAYIEQPSHIVLNLRYPNFEQCVVVKSTLPTTSPHQTEPDNAKWYLLTWLLSNSPINSTMAPIGKENGSRSSVLISKVYPSYSIVAKLVPGSKVFKLEQRVDKDSTTTTSLLTLTCLSDALTC